MPCVIKVLRACNTHNVLPSAGVDHNRHGRPGVRLHACNDSAEKVHAAPAASRHGMACYGCLDACCSPYTDPATHVIYPTILQTGAATGRLSCPAPNLMGLPKVRGSARPRRAPTAVHTNVLSIDGSG